MAQWIGDVPKDICHSDPSSVDSLKPVGESGVETPYRNGWVEYNEDLPPLCACGPARCSPRMRFALVLGSGIVGRSRLVGDFGV